MAPKKGKRKGGGTGTAPRRRHDTYEVEDAYHDVAADSGVSLSLFCGSALRLDEMLDATVNAVVPDFLQFIQGHFDQLNETKQHLRDIMREETGGTRAVPKTPARSDFLKVKAMVNKLNEFNLSSIKVELEEEEDESNSGDNLGPSRNLVRPFTLDSDEDKEQSANPERRGPAAARNIFEESDDDQDIPQSSTPFTATRASASLKANPSAKVKKNDSQPVSAPDLATPNLASTRGRLDAQLNMDSEGDDDEIHPRNTRAQAQKASQNEKREARSQKKKPKPAAATQRGNATPRKMTEREKRVNKREEEEKKRQEQGRQKIEANLAAAEQTRKQEMQERAERARREREEKQKRVQLKKEEQEKERKEMLEKRKKMEEMAEAIRERNRQNSPRRAASKSPARGFQAAGMNATFSPQRCASKSPARTRCPGRATPSRGVQDGAASAGRSRPQLGSIFNNKRTAVPASPATPKVPAMQSRFGQPPSLARNFFGETDSEKEDEKELRLAREKKREEEENSQEQRRQKFEADLAAAEQTRKQEMQEIAERARREREEKQKRVQLKKEEQEKERKEMLERRQKREDMAEAIRERNRQNSPRRAASKSPARTRSPGGATPSRGVQDGAASAGTARPQFSCCCSFFNNKRTAVPWSPATLKVPDKQSHFGQPPSLARNFFDERDSEKEDGKELQLAREKKGEEEERERSRIRKMEAAALEKQRIIELLKERERKEEDRLNRDAEKKERARLEAEMKEKEQKERERKQEKEREQRQSEKEEEMEIVHKHLLNASMDENVTATSSYDITPDKEAFKLLSHRSRENSPREITLRTRMSSERDSSTPAGRGEMEKARRHCERNALNLLREVLQMAAPNNTSKMERKDIIETAGKIVQRLMAKKLNIEQAKRVEVLEKQLLKHEKDEEFKCQLASAEASCSAQTPSTSRAFSFSASSSVFNTPPSIDAPCPRRLFFLSPPPQELAPRLPPSTRPFTT